jgi:hypothetical protein
VSASLVSLFVAPVQDPNRMLKSVATCALLGGATALFANLQSLAPLTLEVSKDGEIVNLEVPPFTPFLSAATQFALKNDLVKDIPVLTQALERKAAPSSLIVARTAISVSGQDFQIVQYSDETPIVAARRFANENKFVEVPSLDRILRCVVHKNL